MTTYADPPKSFGGYYDYNESDENEFVEAYEDYRYGDTYEKYTREQYSEDGGHARAQGSKKRPFRSRSGRFNFFLPRLWADEYDRFFIFRNIAPSLVLASIVPLAIFLWRKNRRCAPKLYGEYALSDPADCFTPEDCENVVFSTDGVRFRLLSLFQKFKTSLIEMETNPFRLTNKILSKITCVISFLSPSEIFQDFGTSAKEVIGYGRNNKFPDLEKIPSEENEDIFLKNQIDKDIKVAKKETKSTDKNIEPSQLAGKKNTLIRNIGVKTEPINYPDQWCVFHEDFGVIPSEVLMCWKKSEQEAFERYNLANSTRSAGGTSLPPVRNSIG